MSGISISRPCSPTKMASPGLNRPPCALAVIPPEIACLKAAPAATKAIPAAIVPNHSLGGFGSVGGGMNINVTGQFDILGDRLVAFITRSVQQQLRNR